MAADNLLVITAVQTEGEKVLSRLTLEYPNLENSDANMIQLGYVQAMIDKAVEFADIKSGGKLAEVTSVVKAK